MTLQIITLQTNTLSDGSFSVSGVFWLTAPSTFIIPIPTIKSAVPTITQAQLALLQNGTIVEQSFNTGLYPSGTSLSTVQTDLQTQYTNAQNALNSAAPTTNGFVGMAFDGYNWSTNSSPINVPTQSVTIQNTALVSLSGVPMTSDGRPNFAPNAFPIWASLYFTGRGDDRTNGIGQGTPFQIASDGYGTDGYGNTTITWQYNDPIFVLGAIVNFTGAQLGDYLDYMIYAPGTTTGTGTQSINPTNIGPGNILVPVASGGSTTVDLTQAIPVPNPTNTGWWDYSLPITGMGTITPNYNNTGGYDLYDFTLPLAHVAVQVPLVGDNMRLEIIIESVTSMMLFPQWLHVGTVHNATGHSGLRLGWCFAAARANSV